MEGLTGSGDFLPVPPRRLRRRTGIREKGGPNVVGLLRWSPPAHPLLFAVCGAEWRWSRRENSCAWKGLLYRDFLSIPPRRRCKVGRGRREAVVCKGVCCSGLPDHPFPPPLAQSGGGRGNSRVPGACFSTEQAGHLWPGRKNL